jgi:hypothetical protein
MGKNKQEWRKYMASISFSEKIKILEMLRERSRVIAAAGLRKQAPSGAGPEQELRELESN